MEGKGGLSIQPSPRAREVGRAGFGGFRGEFEEPRRQSRERERQMAAREGERAKRYEAAGANTFVRGKIFTGYWNLLKLTDWGGEVGSGERAIWAFGCFLFFFFFPHYCCL